MNSKKQEYVGILCIIGASVLYGIMPLLSKTAYQYGSNANTAAFVRFLSAAVILGVIVAISKELSFKLPKQAMKDILLLSAFYGVTPILLFSSYEYIGSSLAATLHFTYPVTVMLLSAVIFRMGFEKLHLVCIVCCMSGVLCFYTPGADMSLYGMIVAVASGCTFALYMVFLGRSTLSRYPTQVVTFWLSALSTIWIGLIGAVSGKLILVLPWQAQAAHIGLGFFSTVLALVLFQKGVFLCGSVRASLLSTFEPLTGVVIGILIYHELFTVRIALGIVLILLSTTLLVKQKK